MMFLDLSRTNLNSDIGIDTDADVNDGIETNVFLSSLNMRASADTLIFCCLSPSSYHDCISS